MVKLVEIFADGACSGNPGPGGYGAILRYGDKVKEISGCELMTTNNRMELRAGMSEWVPQWIRKNWISSSKKPVLNRELWEALVELSRPHVMEWQWIRGHAGHKENERCDQLARTAILRCLEEAARGNRE
jgi:ribonuclease HI